MGQVRSQQQNPIDSFGPNGSYVRQILGHRPSDHATTSQAGTVPADPEVPAQAPSLPSPNHVPDIQNLLQRIQRLEKSAKRPIGEADTGHSEAGRRTPKRQCAGDPSESLDWQTVMNKSRDMGKGDWKDIAQEFTPVIACWGELMGKPYGDSGPYQEPETAALIAEAGEYLGKCKNTAKSIKLIRPTRGLSTSADFLAPPPRELSDDLAKLYFQCFESTHRILHAPSFWTGYQRFWDSPDSVTTDLRLTVLLVTGIGSSLYDHGSPEAALLNAELVHHWIYAAETWLAGPLEKDRVDLTGLQVYCLTILARQIFSIGGDTVWMSMGSLIHRAMQLGLHRDPKKLPGRPVSVLQAELRRRLWATILELIVQSSLDSRMPPRISFDEFDAEQPSNINDEEIDESSTAATLQPHPEDQFTSTSIQLALLRSLPVRVRILKLLNGIGHEEEPSESSQSQSFYNLVLSLTAELTDSLRANNTLITKNSQKSIPFHRNLLDYLVRRFIIPLHYSFSNQARINPMYYYSLKLSLDAALAIMSPEEPDPGFKRLMTSAGGLFREGFRVAMMGPCLELLVHVQAQASDGTLHRTTQYRDLLKQVVRDMISLAEQRIRHGETNVKSHMFLSMVLAQVQAIEDDLPVDLQLAKSARDSLEYCYGILRLRAEKMSLAPTPTTTSDATAAAGLAGSGVDMSNGYGYGLDFDWESFLPDQGFAT
ncbi:Transcription factor asR3 [Exophiala dermatitidis]